MVWKAFVWVEFASLSIVGAKGVVAVPLFCWLLEKGEPEPKPVEGCEVPPKVELGAAPPKRLLLVLAPKAGLEVDPKAEPEPVPKPPVDVPPPKPPNALLEVAVVPPKRLGELVALPKAGLLWPKGDELLALAPNPGQVSDRLNCIAPQRNGDIQGYLPPPKPVLALDALPNRLLPPVFAEPKADGLLLAFAAKPDVAVEPKPPKAEVVWFWLEPKPLPPKPPKPDMLMGRSGGARRAERWQDATGARLADRKHAGDERRSAKGRKRDGQMGRGRKRVGRASSREKVGRGLV